MTKSWNEETAPGVSLRAPNGGTSARSSSANEETSSTPKVPAAMAYFHPTTVTSDEEEEDTTPTETRSGRKTERSTTPGSTTTTTDCCTTSTTTLTMLGDDTIITTASNAADSSSIGVVSAPHCLSSPPPTDKIFVREPLLVTTTTTTTTPNTITTNTQTTRSLPAPEEDFRAVHKVRLSALRHNFACVESAAHRQRCSVIVVVKADGYGHGALATALYLADGCGADAFAVATLEEGIALRKAFENNPPGRWTKDMACLFPHGLCPIKESTARRMRPTQIRILVLGPPVGFPRCFDDYFFHGIEVMCSGPEVASALLHWVANENDRKRTQVERAAMEAKEKALLAARRLEMFFTETQDEKKEQSKDPRTSPLSSQKLLRHPSSTLGNVSGQDLAKEVRAILMNQKAAEELALHTGMQPKKPVSSVSAPVSEMNSSTENSVASDTKSVPIRPQITQTSGNTEKRVFGGIESAARSSRAREVAAAHAASVFDENSEEKLTPSLGTVNNPAVPPHRKRLRWHALVDSGMGRLGFRTEFVKRDETGRRDTVDILKEMVDMEIIHNAPIEFYGMCTHMADATSTSDYTNSQIARFTSLLKRVRDAGIQVPTVSTDNSAALLTTNLNHFDPVSILSQPNSDTRGYVRTGGAIYGQRPAFSQLKSISTLMASVRHVAILQKGESVGYDRAYIAPYDVRIATLTIGFADGYPRDLGNGVGRVQIRGEAFPVAGNVCMDMLMVELGPSEDRTGIGATITVGDTAVLWGPVDENEKEGMVRLQDIAGRLKTTQSALTCGLDKTRVLRKYV